MDKLHLDSMISLLFSYCQSIELSARQWREAASKYDSQSMVYFCCDKARTEEHSFEMLMHIIKSGNLEADYNDFKHRIDKD